MSEKGFWRVAVCSWRLCRGKVRHRQSTCFEIILPLQGMHSRLNIDIFLFSTKLPCRSIWHTNRYFVSHSYCISFFRCLWQFSQAPSGFLTSAHSQAPCSLPPLPPSLFPSSSPSWAPSGSRTKKKQCHMSPRYLFGLPPPKDSWMPGTACRGFVPCILLAIVTVLIYSVVHIYLAYIGKSLFDLLDV